MSQPLTLKMMRDAMQATKVYRRPIPVFSRREYEVLKSVIAGVEGVDFIVVDSETPFSDVYKRGGGAK